MKSWTAFLSNELNIKCDFIVHHSVYTFFFYRGQYCFYYRPAMIKKKLYWLARIEWVTTPNIYSPLTALMHLTNALSI